MTLNHRKPFRNAEDSIHVKQNLFSKSIPSTIDVLEENRPFIDDFASRFPSDFNEELKEKMVETLKSAIAQDFRTIEKFKKNPKLFEEVRDGLLKLEEAKKQKVDPASLTPFLSTLINTFVIAGANNLLPGLGLLIAATYPAAAAAASSLLQVMGGVPNGASDPCDGFGGYMVSCLQGYLADQTGTWQPELPQFFRLVQQGNGKGTDDGAFLQLRDCLSVDKVGEPLKKAFLTYPDNNTVTCTAQPAEWYGWQASVTAKNMPESACSAFKDDVASAVQDCSKYSGLAKWDWIIAGGSIGGMLLLVACCAGAYYCLKSDNKCTDTVINKLPCC